MPIVTPSPRSPQPRSPPPSSHSPQARPPSRSERLLRDTLRKDDILRTTGAAHPRPRSRSACSSGDPDSEDEDFFRLIMLHSPQRNSTVPVSSQTLSRGHSHGHGRSYYVPNEDEHTSYIQSLRSPSFSGSSRSRKSEPTSPQFTSFIHEKQDAGPLYMHDAPHEAVLRTQLEHVLHLSTWEAKCEKEWEAGASSIESSAGSPLSSHLSLSNSQHSHASDQTHLTTPECDAFKPSTPPPHLSRDLNSQVQRRGHRFVRSISSVNPASMQPTKSPHSPSGRPQSYTPHQTRNQHPHSHTNPNSVRSIIPPPPPSPPSQPPIVAAPAKHTSPVVAPANATHLPLVYDTLRRLQTPTPAVWSSHSPAQSLPAHQSHAPRSHDVHTHTPTSLPTFDSKAASLACQQAPGYISFTSVAGLGAPPDDEDQHPGRRVAFGTKSGRLAALGLGRGKWWVL